ncbi:PASTA domain-containing protein [Actinomycetospora sp. TBRC 11914]|uniref:PASTA domain-containing protein n=1 Tax=Actinomycetospora sp. TBRC 11914 TaxID=2729387 RepID=UPI00145EEB20|nr:PASTA domain-containing protein [Actinomycetospora sp. TBRC 11914]NMO93920.1 PASTA domain-containing protein [Actinomycetospora sp. TBRC 11914]
MTEQQPHTGSGAAPSIDGPAVNNQKAPVSLGKAIGGTFVAVTLFSLIIALIGAVNHRGSVQAPVATASPAMVSPAVAEPAAAPKLMPNLVGLTSQQYLNVLVAVYPESHPTTDDDGSDPTATIVSQEPAAGTALEPEDGPVVLHMSDTGSNPPPTAATDTDTSSGNDDSGSGHHYIPHPHVHACVGGRHIHVCS